MRIEDKLAILADAAKFDASCASSGSRRKGLRSGLGNAAPSGICHTYTEDGRCVSLLKILFTNACIYDCAYCVSRRANDIPRAAFTPREVVSLTTDFYRRNYIEGLFLSSGVVRSPDDTMERLIRTVRDLRKAGFGGYVHLKCVPGASPELVRHAGLHADRLSVNIELPSEPSLRRLAREKTYPSILGPMGVIRDAIEEFREDRKRLRHAPDFAPAGQSTQLIVGASPESDLTILDLADGLYRRQSLRRVYYSAYIPAGPAGSRLPGIGAPALRREHRLYQADWLLRLYGFDVGDLLTEGSPHLDLTVDPKQAWAARHPERFPVDVNTADRRALLRVPGIGLRSARRIVGLRRSGRIRPEHLGQMGVVLSRAAPFLRWDAMGGGWRGADLEAAPPEGPHGPGRAPRRVWETDGSFGGLLTAVFESYRRGEAPDAVAPPGQAGLFDRRVAVPTEPSKAARVWEGLARHLGRKGRRRLFEAFLSEAPGVETALMRHIRDRIPAPGGAPAHGADLAARIRIEKLSGRVRREAHRMKGFLRFRRSGDGRFLALFAPRYDVLPLVRRHFETRFSDQRWIVYDTARHYGIGSEGGDVREVLADAVARESLGRGDDGGEELCRSLWRRYYAAATISQRADPDRHRRMLPKRFWPHLPEKQG
jgi:probable DNA metabolism protein